MLLKISSRESVGSAPFLHVSYQGNIHDSFAVALDKPMRKTTGGRCLDPLKNRVQNLLADFSLMVPL